MKPSQLMGTYGNDPKGVWFCSTLSTHLALHSHVGPELNLVMSGRLAYEIGAQKLEVQAGELLVIEAGVQHQIIEASQGAAFWVLELSAGDVLPWFDVSATHCAEEDWARTFVAISRKLWLRPSSSAEDDLWEALFELLRSGPPRGQPKTIHLHPAVERARVICQSELEGELPMTTLAKRAGISPSRLSHLFQDQLGITPLQYRNFCRIQQFISQYGAGDENLMRASLRSGFGSYPQFHRAFQQVCGAPPGAHLARLLREAWMSPSRTLPPQLAV